MTIIPRISKALQAKHAGESVAIVNGKMVAFGKDSFAAEEKALEKGYKKEDVMTTLIMGRENYAL
jgi:hypothetical protein